MAYSMDVKVKFHVISSEHSLVRLLEAHPASLLRSQLRFPASDVAKAMRKVRESEGKRPKIVDFGGVSAPMARFARSLSAFGGLLGTTVACEGKARVDHGQTKDVASTQWLKLQTIKYRRPGAGFPSFSARFTMVFNGFSSCKNILCS